MTATALKEEKKWGDKKKMEGEVSLKTLDCLRGRLLAERQASRMAKEEAELMGNKLIELENKLREETKLRQKAEMKLKFLMKKFDSLKISPTLLEGLGQSSPSETCGLSCSSSASTSGSKDPEESAQNHSVLPTEKSSSNSLDSNSNSDVKDSSFNNKSNCQDSKADSESSSNSEASMVETERSGRSKQGDREKESDIQNSWALVPVSLAQPTVTSKSNELYMVGKSINEVLDALRHAKENIQSSMELRRNTIRVGPT